MPDILLIDDYSLQLKILARQLHNLGYDKVTGYETARAALTALERPDARADILFLDLNMPDIDGVEMLRQLAERRYPGSLILVSGEDPTILDAVVRLATAHGLHVLGHLSKPCESAAIATLLQQWQASKRSPITKARKIYGPDEIGRAIDCHELTNVYQPKVALQDGTVSGVETLVRWHHPQDGLVFPDQFIGVAEQHGLINQLTLVVIDNALTQARRWRDAGLRLKVAVNISMDDLVALDFPEYLARELQRHGVPVTDLIIEVTESRIVRDYRVCLDILTRLRLKRIGLSIDDFGTGHSSLIQLRDLPFDELKIDRGFVHGAARDATLGVIAAASIGLAHQLGMTTVGEGVETPEDWHWLRAKGCDLAQGYFIAKPMPAEDLVDWLAEWTLRQPDLLAP